MKKIKKAKGLPGEVRVRASANGREMSLDPIKSFVIQIPVRRVESILCCGFQQNWVSGSNGKNDFGLDVGAGLGSRWMTFCYLDKQYCIDAEDIIKLLVEMAEGDKD